MCLLHAVIRRLCLFLSLDKTEHVRLSAYKIRVFEVPKLRLVLGAEDALLEMWNLVESVHVQLADKRTEVLMFEPATQYLVSESLLVEYCKHTAKWPRVCVLVVEVDNSGVGYDIPKKESPVSDHLMRSSAGSLTIL